MRTVDLVDGGLYLIDKEVCRYDSWKKVFAGGEHSYMATLDEEEVVVNSKNAPEYIKVNPIPLTDDILIENGFTWDSEMEEFRLKGRISPEDSWHIEVFSHSKLKSAYIADIFFGHNGWSNEVRKLTINVHTFQAALRVCGLTRLLNNFKVTYRE